MLNIQWILGGGMNVENRKIIDEGWIWQGFKEELDFLNTKELFSRYNTMQILYKIKWKI